MKINLGGDASPSNLSRPCNHFSSRRSSPPTSRPTTPRLTTPLHFARGATVLNVRGHLSGSQRRVYSLKTRSGQKLCLSVAPAFSRGLQFVPLLQVTPPRSQYDGEKTARYATNFTRAGFYRIEIAANQMASNARSGAFVLRISAR